MTRVTLDTGNNGITLELEYGSLVDAKTNGSITASTTKVKFATLDAYIRAGSYAFWSGTNQLAASGGWAIDKSWSNIAIGSSSSPLKNAAKKLATLGKQERDVVFGKTNGTYNVTLKMTGVLSAGTMQGSYSRVVPRRPYHAPYDPVVELSNDFISISGNQTSSSSDRYWGSLLWALATDDVWSTDAKMAGSTTSIPFVPSTNGKYQARAKAENADGTSGYGYSNIFYGAPSAPSNVQASRPLGSTTVTISWVPTAPYADSHVVQRYDGSDWIDLAAVPGNAHVTTEPLGSTALYRVLAVTPDLKRSNSSGVVSVNEGWKTPASPTVALTRDSATEVTVTFSGHQNNPAADKYWESLHYQVFTGAEVLYTSGDVAGSTGSIQLTRLPSNTRVYVTAMTSNSTGGQSPSVLSGFVYTTIPTPHGLTAKRLSEASIDVKLSFEDESAYPGSYSVERSVSGGAWSQIAFRPASYGREFYVTQSVNDEASYRVLVASPASQVWSLPSNEASIGLAFLNSKDKYLLGVDQVVRQYVGPDRARRSYLGSGKLWEDGTP